MSLTIYGRVRGYFNVLSARTRFVTDYPAASKWQSSSIMAFTLFWRLVPVAALGLLPALVINATWTGVLAQAACAPALTCFVAGVLLAVPAGFRSGGPDFFPQAVLPLALKYATRLQA
ncbi:MAG: hypothetical protein WCD35_04945 [Mycobacteriales bacterium]